MQHFVNVDTIVVVDAGGSSYWSPAYLELAPENQAVYPRGAAAIGSALPMALGAQTVDVLRKMAGDFSNRQCL